ncbi:MAG TPA: hypothetical protein VMH22_08225 [bacterium]|nr:hypothetical protein [bacterium]
MRRCVAVGFLVLVVLCGNAGAVEFGADLGTRAATLWPAGYYGYPGAVRGGAFDLLADVPLSKVFSVNFRPGGFTSTDKWKADDGTTPAVNLFALDARVALFASVPIVKDAVTAYAGVGATFDWVRYWNVNVTDLPFQRVVRTGVTVGVPAGLKLRLSRCITACLEMEVPDQGWYHDVIEENSAAERKLDWSQYGSVEPSVCAAVYLAH